MTFCSDMLYDFQRMVILDKTKLCLSMPFTKRYVTDRYWKTVK